jgi:hypothetical protein
MAALATPTISQLKEFYPVSESLPTAKIEEFSNYVKNHLFLKMFGFDASTQIAAGTIPNSNSSTFIGFQKFFALCVAYQTIKDPLVSTNFGAKIINRQGVVDPTNNQKSIILIDIENTISIHYRQALEVVQFNKCEKVPSWSGYFSYKISRL